MEKDQEQRHTCKFCSKSFPCGRSLGGHMRSHFITIDHRKNDDKSSRKKKTSKFAEDDDSTTQKSCKECGKAFQSWKALFGHMKCHSVNVNVKNCMDEDSTIMDSQSDNKAAAPSCRKKRSDRMMKRCTATTASSSLTATNSMSEMDQHEQEEVALSLIILSRDKGWAADNSPQLSEAEETDHCPKRMRKSRCVTQLDENDETESKFTCSICKKAFSSHQALGGHRASHKKFKGCCAPENSLETENSNNQSENAVSRKKSRDHECPICYKVFPSGQALGGHKRSHLIMDQIKNDGAVEMEKPAREIRGFLDLNLPAPVEEECSEFKPWWVGARAGAVLGLLSS